MQKVQQEQEKLQLIDKQKREERRKKKEEQERRLRYFEAQKQKVQNYQASQAVKASEQALI